MTRARVASTLIGTGCLVAGIAAMAGLILLRKPPAEALTDAELTLAVEAVRVTPTTIVSEIVGYGEVRTITEVPVTAEVAGKVIELYPNLEPGVRIPAGETLFVIDPRPYEAQVSEGRAAVAQAAATLARMRSEWDHEKKRLAAGERSRDLASAQYERLKALLKEDVGTVADLDRAEQAFVQARDEADRLLDSVNLYPIRIEEMTESLEAAKARLAMAEISLEKTRVVAPFDARVKDVALEVNSFVAPGAEILTLADDSILEIQVKLPSRDVHDWMQFAGSPAQDEGWFGGLENVSCNIHWTEAPEARSWTGTLARVEAFDPEARTITAAIRVEGAAALSDGFPLVEGMFCKVRVPGRSVEGVFRIPQSAVNLDQSVYVAVDNRLKSVPVEVVRQEGNDAFVSTGLREGDLVVTTKLVNPLENSLLALDIANAEAAS